MEKKKPDFESPSSPKNTSDVISSTIDSHSRLGNSEKNCGIDKCNEEFHKLKDENASLKRKFKNAENEKTKLDTLHSNLLKELANCRRDNLKTNSSENFSEKFAQNQDSVEFSDIEIKKEIENSEIENDFDFVAHDLEDNFEIKNEFDLSHAQVNS